MYYFNSVVCPLPSQQNQRRYGMTPLLMKLMLSLYSPGPGPSSDLQVYIILLILTCRSVNHQEVNRICLLFGPRWQTKMHNVWKKPKIANYLQFPWKKKGEISILSFISHLLGSNLSVMMISSLDNILLKRYLRVPAGTYSAFDYSDWLRNAMIKYSSIMIFFNLGPV